MATDKASRQVTGQCPILQSCLSRPGTADRRFLNCPQGRVAISSGVTLLTVCMNLRLNRVSFVVERHDFVYNVRSSLIPNCGIAAAAMVVRERE